MQSDAFRIRGPISPPPPYVLFSASAVIGTCVVLLLLLADAYGALYGDVITLVLAPPLGFLSFAQGFAVFRRSKSAAWAAAVTCLVFCVPLAAAALGWEVLAVAPLAVFAAGCAANLTWARTLARWPPIDPRADPPGFPVLPPRREG